MKVTYISLCIYVDNESNLYSACRLIYAEYDIKLYSAYNESNLYSACIHLHLYPKGYVCYAQRYKSMKWFGPTLLFLISVV